MKKYYLLLLSAAVFCLHVNAQISQGGEPVSFTKHDIGTYFEVKTLPALDMPAIIAAEEALGDEPRPYKFAQPVAVNLSTANSGTWEDTKKGRLWRLGITSAGAYSLNFVFSNFYLPEGAKLFIYNPEKDYILGAFTAANNEASHAFATDLMKGETAILEYYEPEEVKGQGIIELGTVSHGYKDIFHIMGELSVAGSGSCNNDINCPGWESWQDDKRAVGIMMTTSNISTAFCTGAMVRDVPQSGTPYFLTANHCLSGSVSTWVYRFNYEHSVCNQNGTPASQSLTGSTLRASNAASDFALIELNSAPPANYNVYYAGWDRSGNTPSEGTGIHHPNGDVKKISQENDALVSTGWPQTPSNSHWKVQEWDSGVTEPGSSGSPLFDQNHRIVGQLHGGASSCGGSDLSDEYGKFSLSWGHGTTDATRLSNWLDPQGTDTVAVNGWDPNMPVIAYDAGITSIISPMDSMSYCSTLLDPVIIIKNAGYTVLTAIDITYSFDGGAASIYNWTGTLGVNVTDTITLPQVTLADGPHTFTVFTSIPGHADGNTANDTLSSGFTILADGNILTVTIHTDGFGDETTWDLKDSTGHVITSSGALAGNTTYVTGICVADSGCYTFTVYDSYGDGMCCAQGNGSFALDDENNYHIAAGGQFLAYEKVMHFCLPIPQEPPSASFVAGDELICEDTTITFTNETGSPVVAIYAWTFEGGTPATSAAATPSVTYSTPGTFDVRLVAVNPFGSDTLVFTDYITVINSPDLTTSSTIDHVGAPPDGTATVEVTDGIPPYSYYWSNGTNSTSNDPTNTITGLGVGTYTVIVNDNSGCRVSKSITVTSNTGVEDQSIESFVKIYPNPAKDMVTVELPAGKEAKTCDLYNVIGAKIESFAVNGKQRFQLDLGAFAKGVYFLRINVGEQLITKKIILSK